MRKLLSLVILAALGFAACKKYPEGPAFSFRSESSRVSNKWAIEQVLVNGSESTPFYSKYTFDIADDGTYTEFNTNVNLTGTWELTSGNDSMIVKLADKNVLHRFKIMKLKNSSLWLSENRNTSVYEWHLK